MARDLAQWQRIPADAEDITPPIARFDQTVRPGFATGGHRRTGRLERPAGVQVSIGRSARADHSWKEPMKLRTADRAGGAQCVVGVRQARPAMAIRDQDRVAVHTAGGEQGAYVFGGTEGAALRVEQFGPFQPHRAGNVASAAAAGGMVAAGVFVRITHV
ncbi:MAG: hypothetical protein IPK29_15440 [Betaproteobacteria bacterium]|nr:hypothetical protein [Betaproteobacteria bacterium]